MCILYVVSSIPTYVVRSYLRHLVAKEVTAPNPTKYPPKSCIELQNLFLNFHCFQCSNPSKSVARNEKNMFYVYRIYFIGSTYPVYVLILKYS